MNAYSILHNYDQPLYSPDFNFINAALSYKQEKLDNNRAKLQNMYDQFPKLQVAKGVDKQYIESRLQQVRQISSKYEMLDLSDDTLASSLLTNAAQIFDDKVKEAVVSTKRMEIEDTQWAEALKKADGKYNQTYHEYALAMSDRQRYLSTQEAGDRYRGGADFIAYTGTEKKVAELTAKAAEQLKQKAFESRGSGGYFNYQDTYEFTDKNTLRQIVESSLDDNDKRHFQIMGWKQFQGSSDEDVKNEYRERYISKADKYKDILSNLEILEAKATGETKEFYQKEIESVKDGINNLDSRISDDRMKNADKNGLASELYYEDYLENTVSPYATKRWIDREVDQVQKANVEFQETLRKTAFDEKMRSNADRRAEEKFPYEIAKLQKELGITPEQNGVAPVGGTTGINPTADNTSDKYKEEVKGYDGIEIFHKEKQASEKEIKNMFGITTFKAGDFKILTEQFGDLANKLKTGGSVEINGKSVKVTPENFNKLNRFKNNVLEVPPAIKATRQQYVVGIDQTLDNLADKVVKGTLDKSVIPSINFEIIEKNGELVVKKLDPTKAGNNYLALLRKIEENGINSLTKAQQATVRSYGIMHAVADKNSRATTSQKMEMAATMRSEVLKGMSMDELQKIPSNVGEINNAFTVSRRSGGQLDRSSNIVVTSDFAKQMAAIGVGNVVNSKDGRASLSVPINMLSEVGAIYRLHSAAKAIPDKSSTEYKNMLQEIDKLKRSLGTKNGIVSYAGKTMTNEDQEKIKWSAMPLGASYNKKVDNTDLGSFSTDLDKAYVLGDRYANELQTKAYLASTGGLSFNPTGTEKEKYKAVRNYAASIGVVGAESKDQIFVEPEVINQKQTGRVIISKSIETTSGDKKGQVQKSAGQYADLEEFERQTGVRFGKLQRSDFSIVYGTNAAKVDFGRSGQNLSYHNIKDADPNVSIIEANAQANGTWNNIAISMNDFNAGKYSFKMEVTKNGQPYSVSIYKNIKGRNVLVDDTYFPPSSDVLTDEDVVQNVMNADVFIKDAYVNYLDKLSKKK